MMLQQHEEEVAALLAIFGEYGKDPGGCIQLPSPPPSYEDGDLQLPLSVATVSSGVARRAATTALRPVGCVHHTVPLWSAATLSAAQRKHRTAATPSEDGAPAAATRSQFNVVCVREGEGGMAVDQGNWDPRLVAVLTVDLPPLYHSAVPPTPTLVASTKVSPECFTSMQTAIDNEIANNFTPGNECLLGLVTRTLELFDTHLLPLLTELRAADSSEASVDEDDDPDLDLDFLRINTEDLLSPQGKANSPTKFLSPKLSDAVVLGRRVCYSHHIRAPTKREFIIRWALELSLSGVSRVGYPGIIIVEGLEPHCEEYVWRLKRLRWKHFICRGQERIESESPTQTVDDLRKFPRGFVELGPGGDSMSELAKYCRQSGLEHLFLASMRIQKV